VEKLPSLKHSDIDLIIDKIASPHRKETFKKENEVDFSYGIKGV